MRMPWLAALAITVASPLHAQTRTAVDSSFRTFLAHRDTAMIAQMAGDPTSWNADVSSDPTLFSPLGWVRIGHEAVTKQYAWAASMLRDELVALHTDYLSIQVDGDLAITVAVEQHSIRRHDTDSAATAYTRVTQIFRREDGAWKLAHRHMDQIRETAPAPAPAPAPAH
ncbi:MAG: YybH family protein [Gemmatimonadales bacterium]